MKRALVVCIGNELLADDGVGPSIGRCLRARPTPAHVRLVDLGLLGVDLLSILEGEETLVVVDATAEGRAPGDVRVTREDGTGPLRAAVSAHGIGLPEVLAMGTRLCPEVMPTETFRVGVEGRRFSELGEGLSQEVAAAIPSAIEAIDRLVRWETASYV
jgi:hydrogenase maturation protease